jgi:hypothetical protein
MSFPKTFKKLLETRRGDVENRNMSGLTLLFVALLSQFVAGADGYHKAN